MTAQRTSQSVMKTADPHCHPVVSSFCLTHIKLVQRLRLYFLIRLQLIIPPPLCSARPPQFQLWLCHQYCYISCDWFCNNKDDKAARVILVTLKSYYVKSILTGTQRFLFQSWSIHWLYMRTCIPLNTYCISRSSSIWIPGPWCLGLSSHLITLWLLLCLFVLSP